MIYHEPVTPFLICFYVLCGHNSNVVAYFFEHRLRNDDFRRFPIAVTGIMFSDGRNGIIDDDVFTGIMFSDGRDGISDGDDNHDNVSSVC